MTLSVDTSQALRTPSEFSQLVEAVLNASPSEPETDSLEWKSEWDLDDAAVRFETARHLLGFGNRNPTIAKKSFEGCAYLLAGVEPGAVPGIVAVDPAELDDQLGRYIAPGQPRWSPHYVSISGKTVLVLSVESPRIGDPICALQKGFDSAPAGRIYVRRHGKTEEAGPADLRLLEQRIQGQEQKIELEVLLVNADQPLKRIRLSDSDRDLWLQQEKSRLDLPSPKEPSVFEIRRPSLTEDIRGREGFAQEVKAYLSEAEKRWLAKVLIRGIREGLASIELQIVNSTERNFEGVEAVIEIPEGPYVWLGEEEVFDFLRAPSPPEPWGKQGLSIRSPAINAQAFSRDEIERGKPNRVRFGSRHVRPGESLLLPPIYLTLPQGWPKDDLSMQWRLTSTGADGWREGELSLLVEEEPIELEVAS